ncbi:amidase family protein [candidate division KSB1 bacterium]
MGYFSAIGLSATLLPGALTAVAQEAEEITAEMIAQAEKIAGLTFTEEERDAMVRGLNRFKDSYEQIRALEMKNDVPPALYFNPIPPGKKIEIERRPFKMRSIDVQMPANIEGLAFYPVTHLARLIETRRITSTELTRMYLARLKKYNPTLLCVVTLTEDLALRQAKRADDEIAAGKYRGPLHGIPWGAKDLLAARGYKTTWGATPYQDQIFDIDATVVQKLDEAGAVLVAKLTMGALAQGDRWFGGRTRNPWNTEQGSSGSSAGPGSAVSAGLVGFGIGTETRGSIVSPSSRCGVSGLRPTFGRVSRYGAMALSWSMDKIGPMCRTAEDCATVFNYIYGPDGNDLAIVDMPFGFDANMNLSHLRVGYIKSILDSEPENERGQISKRSYEEAVNVVRSLGVELRPIELPEFPTNSLSFILSTEAAAAFDQLTLTKNDNEINTWGGTFRQHRFVPGVEYIQANRARTLLMQETDKLFEEIDLFVGSSLGLTNLTGHPEVVLPNGFRDDGTPYSISFTGKLFGESEILAIAHQYQEATGHHLKHPNLDG